jgi:hypothetical protein
MFSERVQRKGVLLKNLNITDTMKCHTLHMLLTIDNKPNFKLYKSTQRLTNVFHTYIIVQIIYISNYYYYHYESELNHHITPPTLALTTPLLDILTQTRSTTAYI